jgi:large repetitive protein
MAAGDTLTLSGGADYTFTTGTVFSAIIGNGSTQGVVLGTVGTVGHTLTVRSLDHLYATSGAGIQVVTLAGTSGNTLGVRFLETLIGNNGNDVLVMTTSGSTMLVDSIETIIGQSSGTELIRLDNTNGNTINISFIESIIGNDGNDVAVTGTSGTTTVTSLIETVIGRSANDIYATISSTIGNTTHFIGAEIILGNGSRTDLISLGAGGNTVGVTFADTLIGSSGFDIVTNAYQVGSINLVTGGTTLSVSNIEVFAGGTGKRDALILADTNTTITIADVDTLIGSDGIDVVTVELRRTTQIVGITALAAFTGANTMLVALIETLIGSSDVEIISLTAAGSTLGNTIRVEAIETLVGNSGTDVALLTATGNTLTVRLLESLTGGSGIDVVTGTGASGTTLALSLIESLTGGTGLDVAALGSGGNTLEVSLFESLTGGSGRDVVSYGSGGGTLNVSLVEALTGGAGLDAALLGTGGNTLSIALLESLTGGSGTDVVALAAGGNTLAVSLLESITGGSGADSVALAAGGNTLAVSLLESITGGSDTDSVALAAGGNTLVVSLLESITGGSGTDTLLLEASSNTLTVNGLETVIGGAGTDVLTFTETAGTIFVTGIETVVTVSETLSLAGATQTIVIGAVSNILYLTTSGATVSVNAYETIIGESGTDIVTFTRTQGTTMAVQLLETLIGSGLTDVITTTGTTGSTMQVTLVESLQGGSGADVISLGTDGNTLAVSGVETLRGGAGTDIVSGIGGLGFTMAVSLLESLTGSSVTDVVTSTGTAGTTLLVTAVETVIGSSGTDVIGLAATGNTLLVSAIEALTGGAGLDAATLGSGGNTLSVALLESLTGGSGADSVALAAGGNTLAVSLLESLTGGSGADSIALAAGGNTLAVSLLESITGGSGADSIALAAGGNTLAVSLLESISGGSGADSVALAAGGNTLSIALLESITGGSGADSVALAVGGNTLAVSLLESITGGSGADSIALAAGGNTLAVSLLESITGGSGADSIALAAGGNTLAVSLLESLTGGSGADSVALAAGGNTVSIALLESITGGSGADSVALAAGGNTVSIALLESITGGSGTDSVALAAGGNTVSIALLESITGGSGADSVALAAGGNTLAVSLLESITGGSGADSIALAAGGNTLSIALLESITGGSGADRVALAAGGNTLAVSLLESIIGGSGADALLLGASGNTVTVNGLETVIGGAGTDILTFTETAGTIFVTGIETVVTVSETLSLAGATQTVVIGAVSNILYLTTNGATVSVNAYETIIGESGTDIVTFTRTQGTTMAVQLLETLIGSGLTDVISTTGTTGSTMLVTLVESLQGGSGTDVISLGTDGNTLAVSGLETLSGGAGTDIVSGIGGLGFTMAVSLLESLTGSSVTDVVTSTGTAGTTLLVTAVETVIGSSGTDVIGLAATGNTVLVSAIEALTGGAGLDAATLGGGGNTLSVALLESLTGGSGTDVITGTGTSGSTLTLSLVETLVGGAALDAVQLGNSGNSLTVWLVESVTGGSGSDVLTVATANGGLFTAAGTLTVQMDGGAGNDTLTGGAGSDTLIGGTGSDRLSGGDGQDIFDVTDGDTITDFTDAADTIRINGTVYAKSDMSIATSGADAVLTIGTGTPIVVTLAGRAGLTVNSLIVSSSGGSTLISTDTVVPTIQSLALSGTPSPTMTSATYTVTFSESVTGVDTADFAVVNTRSSTTTLNGTVASVSGSGSSYTVTVNGISGEGTLRLDFVGAGSGVTDLAGNAIATTTLSSGTAVIDTLAPRNVAGTLFASTSSANGDIVGTITAQDGSTLTYSLTDNANGAYQINATTGVVTVLDASKIVSTGQSIIVRASDGTQSTSGTFVISSANPSAPVDSNASTNVIAEGAAAGTLVGVTAISTDPRAGSISYSLADDAGGRFQIDGTSGVVTVKDGTGLNFETATSHTITVRASSTLSGFSTQTFTIAVGNVVPTTPTDANSADNIVLEGAAAGTLVGITAAATDPGGTAVTYSIIEDASGLFAVNGSTGVVSIRSGVAWSNSVAGTRTITIQADDGQGGRSQKSFDVSITPQAAPAAPSAPILRADSDSGISTTDLITNATTLVLTGTAETGTTISLLRNGIATGATTVAAAGAYQFSVDASQQTGATAFSAVATGPTGRASAASASTTVTLDRSGPTPVSVSLIGSPPVTTQTLTWRVAFSEAVTTPTAAAFGLVSTGAATGNIASVATVDSQTFDVTVTGITGRGTLALTAGGNTITDIAGNTLVGSLTGSAASVGLPALEAVNTSRTLTYVEDSGAVSLGAVSITAAPAGAILTATLTLDNPTLGGISTTGIASYNAATGVWRAVGSIADVNAALAAAGFIPVADNDRAASISLLISDDSAVNAPIVGTFGLAVTPVNDAVRSGVNPGTQAAVEGQAFSLTVPANAFLDADFGDTPTISATLADGSALPSWLVFTAATRSFSGTPGFSDSGTLAIRLTATDRGGATASSDFTLNVADVSRSVLEAVNTSRTLTYVEDSGAVSLGAVSITAAPAGAILTATLTLDNPTLGGISTTGIASYNTATGVWRAVGSIADVNAALAAAGFIPVADNDRAASISLLISDDSAVNAPIVGTFGLAVTPVNDAVRNGVNPGTQAAVEGQAFSLTVPANAFLDADFGDTPTISATLADGSALPSWLVFTAATRSFSGTPGFSDSGTLAIRLTATDRGGATASSDFTLNVRDVSRAPVAVADSGRVSETSRLTVVAPGLLVNDTDPDSGDALRVVGVNGTSVVGGFVTLASGARVQVNADGTYVYDPNGAFEALARGTTGQDSFSYTISDRSGLSSLATVTITIDGESNNLIIGETKLVTIAKNSGPIGLSLGTPVDANGNPTSATVSELPLNGLLLRADGSSVALGDRLTGAELSTLQFRVDANFSGSAGRFVYTVADVANAVNITIAEEQLIGITSRSGSASTQVEPTAGGFTTYTFTISRTAGEVPATDGTVSIDWRISEAGGVNRNDFANNVLPSGTVTFNPGESVKEISIQVRADGAIEGDETFAVELTGMSYTGLVLPPRINNPSSATGTILDADRDRLPPRVTAVQAPAAGNYFPGDFVDIQLTFGETVTVSGNPTLAILVGSAARQATYVAGSGGTTLTFRYTVGEGETDRDGISISNQLSAETAAAIRDAAGNSAVSSFEIGADIFGGVLVNYVRGKTVDGYISGALVFADANGNGVLDVGEARSTTDNAGNYEIAGGSGTYIMVGGTDISTGRVFDGIFEAPMRATVINPLTTGVVSLAGLNAGSAGISAAETQLKAALGIDPSFDLLNTDPLQASTAPGATQAAITAAVKAQAEAAKLANLLVQGSALLVGAATGTLPAGAAGQAVTAAIADAIRALPAGATINLSDSATISSILRNAAQRLPQVNASRLNSLSTSAGDVIAAGGAVIDRATALPNAVDALTEITRSQVVSQGSAATALQQGAAANDLGSAVSGFTGTSLNTAVAGASVGTIIPARLAITALDAARAESDSGSVALTFQVTRTGSDSGIMTVDYRVSGNSGLDAADFGGTLPFGTVTFAAGETVKTITVLATGDGNIEADERFTVTLSNSSAGADILSSQASGIILNDDPSAPRLIAPDAVGVLAGRSTGVSGISVQAARSPTVTVTLTASGGAIALVGPAAQTRSGDSVTLTGTPSEVNATLSGLYFTPLATTTTGTIQIVTSDQASIVSDTRTVTIRFAAAPENILPVRPVVAAGVAGEIIGVSVRDTDSPTLTVTLTPTHGTVGLTSFGNVSVTRLDGGVLRLTGSTAAVQQSLSSIEFTGDVGRSTATLRIESDDNDPQTPNDSDLITIEILQSPTTTLPAPPSVVTGTVSPVVGIAVADQDSSTVSVTLTPTGGRLGLTAVGGATLTQVSDTVIRVNGLTVAVNATLATLTFTATTGVTAAAIRVQTSDLDARTPDNDVTLAITASPPVDDILYLPPGDNILSVDRYASIVGNSGIDVITFARTQGTTMAVTLLESLIGSALTDVVTSTGSAGSTMTVSLLESLSGGSGRDVLIFGGVGNTLAIAGVEALIGSTGKDVLALGNGGNIIAVTALETLTGGSGTDIATLAGSGATTTVAGIETLIGGIGTDFIFLGAGGITMLAQGIDILVGISGKDVITLAEGGNSLLVRALETLHGGSGVDIVTVGNGGITMSVTGIETLLGGAANDVITLSDGGITMLARSIETLIGGNGADVITMIGSGGVRIEGGAGADRITLAVDNAADSIIFSDPGDGAAVGAGTGFDIITNFQSGTDRILLTGTLRGLIDRNGDGIVQGAERGPGEIDLSTDEVVKLTTRVTNLNDAGLADIRTAIGTLRNPQSGGSFLVMVGNATDTGLYMVTKTNGANQVAATEIRLLGVIGNTSGVTGIDMIYG